ncbi:lipase family alpha/beta hydrolase [Pantanalinema sp. GBBB05]|uniref:lipase family alpha/beta hydrolase n=1 Tax=Pantanalinema sp. GBBB05 TaxID=2604139 RepID=UPI001D719F53|nr:alpha/beta hydrolase [Pantanalinema sp. GBBB05]
MAKSPLIFLPGILGSKIQAYDKYYGIIPIPFFDGWWDAWSATAETWIERMEFSSSLTPKYKSRCPGILEQAFVGEPPYPVKDVYILTINCLKSLGYEKDKDLFLCAYDFRYGLDLLANSKEDISERKSLSSFIEEVKQKTSSSKVSLMCHSMGGLVALNYLVSDPNRINNIDRIVLLGTPVFGAAKAFASLTCGFPPDPLYDYLAQYWAPTRLKWKQISRFFSSTYQLIPSRPLVEGIGSFVSIFDQNQSYEQAHGINAEDQINNDLLISQDLLRASFEWKENFIGSLKSNWNAFSSCLYFIQGNNVVTPVKYSIIYPTEYINPLWAIFKRSSRIDWRLAIDNQSTLITSKEGDGTVLNYGLREFLGVDPQRIYQFDRVEHLDLATHPDVLQCAVKLLSS